MNNKQVEIFIVGAPKAGTTSLHYYLDQHSDIFMSSRKELDYFSHKELLDDRLYYGDQMITSLPDYHSFFNGSQNNQTLGESSVSYLFYPKAAQRIMRYNKNAKIIIMLRDPFERSFSHYLMDFRLGLISESFDSVFSSKKGIYFQQYFQLGNYFQQVKEYLQVFGRDNVHIIWYHDFIESTQEQVNEVFRFLGLSKDDRLNFNKKHNVGSLPKNELVRFIYSIYWLRKFFRSLFPDSFVSFLKSYLFVRKQIVLEHSVKKRVYNYYLQDIIDLERMLKVDLSIWKK